MASTISQIKSGLDDIAQQIKQHRSKLAQAKSGITSAKTGLAAMPTQYGELLTDINNLTGSDPFTLLAKDERTKLIAEFQELLSTATSAETAVASIL